VKLAQLASLTYFPLRFEISFRLSMRYARWRDDIKQLWLSPLASAHCRAASRYSAPANVRGSPRKHVFTL